MADTTNASLTPQGVRLECLRLAHRPDKDAGWITQRAEEFERFVNRPIEPTGQSAPVKTDKATAAPRSKSS